MNLVPQKDHLTHVEKGENRREKEGEQVRKFPP